MCASGQKALLAKVDIRNAYRNTHIPVHPDDRWLLGISWKGDIFIDTVLPFGLRSAPKIFNSVVDALEWIVRSNCVGEICHYFDEFLVMGPPGSPQCGESLSTLLGCLSFLAPQWLSRRWRDHHHSSHFSGLRLMLMHLSCGKAISFEGPHCLLDGALLVP